MTSLSWFCWLCSPLCWFFWKGSFLRYFLNSCPLASISWPSMRPTADRGQLPPQWAFLGWTAVLWSAAFRSQWLWNRWGLKCSWHLSENVRFFPFWPIFFDLFLLFRLVSPISDTKVLSSSRKCPFHSRAWAEICTLTFFHLPFCYYLSIHAFSSFQTRFCWSGYPWSSHQRGSAWSLSARTCRDRFAGGLWHAFWSIQRWYLWKWWRAVRRNDRKT